MAVPDPLSLRPASLEDAKALLAIYSPGKGLGRRLYQALLPLLTELGYFKAYAGIALPNPASVGLHEALGFEPVGTYRRVGYKFDAWHDVGWWQFALQPHIADPAAPLAALTCPD